MTQHYDVAVIGGQTSGLITAALLGKRGRRVALLDHGENTTFYRRRGLRLPLVPTLVPVFESSPPIQRVHNELGLSPDLRTTSEVLDPLFQAVMPEHRIDVRPDHGALLAELRDEFPDMVDPVRRFFDQLFVLDEEISTLLAESPPLPPSGLRESLRTRSLLARASHLDAPFESHALLAGIPADHPLRELLLGPLTFFAHLSSESPSTLHAVRLIARFYRGVLSFSDRLGGLQGMLLRAAEQAGVDVRGGAVVKNIELSGRKLRQLAVAGERHPITADYFVASTFGSFHELLPPNRLQARLALSERSTCPFGSLLVINLVIHRHVVPRGMAQAVFLLNGRRHARASNGADPPLFLRRYPARRGEPGSVRTAKPIDDEEHEVLSIASPVQTSDVARSPERLAAIKQQILERVGRLVPFLRSFLVDTSLTVETAGWDVETDDVIRRIDPWTLHPIYDPTRRPVLGVASRSTRTVYKNLVNCGRDVLPGLGLEGEYLAGLAAADTLASIAGRTWSRGR